MWRFIIVYSGLSVCVWMSRRTIAPPPNQGHDTMNITADFNRNFWHLSVGRWQITLSSRAWADDALSDWDAGALAYQRNGSEWCLRLPFLGAFLVRR